MVDCKSERRHNDLILFILFLMLLHCLHSLPFFCSFQGRQKWRDTLHYILNYIAFHCLRELQMTLLLIKQTSTRLTFFHFWMGRLFIDTDRLWKIVIERQRRRRLFKWIKQKIYNSMSYKKNWIHLNSWSLFCWMDLYEIYCCSCARVPCPYKVDSMTS